MFENEILRNYSQNIMVVLRGVFVGLGLTNDPDTLLAETHQPHAFVNMFAHHRFL